MSLVCLSFLVQESDFVFMAGMGRKGFNDQASEAYEHL